MKKNVGTKDANIRTLIAAVLILGVFFFVDNPYIKIVIALISAILAGTAFLRTCPIYHFMGKSTCEDAQVIATPAEQKTGTPTTPHEESPAPTSEDTEPHEPVA